MFLSGLSRWRVLQENVCTTPYVETGKVYIGGTGNYYSDGTGYKEGDNYNVVNKTIECFYTVDPNGLPYFLPVSSVSKVESNKYKVIDNRLLTPKFIKQYIVEGEENGNYVIVKETAGPGKVYQFYFPKSALQKLAANDNSAQIVRNDDLSSVRAAITSKQSKVNAYIESMDNGFADSASGGSEQPAPDSPRVGWGDNFNRLCIGTIDEVPAETKAKNIITRLPEYPGMDIYLLYAGQKVSEKGDVKNAQGTAIGPNAVAAETNNTMIYIAAGIGIIGLIVLLS